MLHKKIFIVFLICSMSLTAQTYKEEKQVVNSSSLDSKEKQLNYVNNLQTNAGFLQNRNSVFIDQVGQDNVAQVSVASNDSQVKLLQDGFNNQSFIFLKADVIRQDVRQIGNQNLFLDYSLHGARSHKVNLVQDGNYNEVISVGKNSISERLQLNQTGVGKRAFIIHN